MVRAGGSTSEVGNVEQSASTLVLVETYRREGEHADLLAAALPHAEVHRLPAPALDESEILARVHEWVAAQAAEFEQLQLRGPVTVGGWSFGGVVAIELARHLSEQGVDVDKVLLMDTSRPRLRPLGVRQAARYHLKEAILLADGARARSYLRASVGSLLQIWRWRVRRHLWRVPVLGRFVRRRRTGGGGSDAGPRLPNDRQVPSSPLKRSIHRSYLNYQATWVPFPVAMLSTRESMTRANEDPTLGWAPFLRSGYAVEVLETTHWGMWSEDDAPGTAAAVARLLS